MSNSKIRKSLLKELDNILKCNLEIAPLLDISIEEFDISDELINGFLSEADLCEDIIKMSSLHTDKMVKSDSEYFLNLNLSNLSALEISVTWEKFGSIFHSQILSKYEMLLLSQKICPILLNKQINIKIKQPTQLEDNCDYFRLSLLIMGTIMPEFLNIKKFLDSNEIMKQKYLELRINIIKEIFGLLKKSNFTSYELYRLKHKYLFENTDLNLILTHLNISIIFIVNNIFDTLTFINYYNGDFILMDLYELREIESKDLYSQWFLSLISITLFPKDLLLMKTKSTPLFAKSKLFTRIPQHFSIFLIINEYTFNVFRKRKLSIVEWNQLSIHHGISDFIINIITTFYEKINGLLKLLNFNNNIFIELKIKAYTNLVYVIKETSLLQITNFKEISDVKKSLNTQLDMFKEDIKKLIIIEKDIIKIIKKNKPELQEYIPKYCESETLEPGNFCETSKKVFNNFLKHLPESFKDLENIKNI